MKNNLRQALLTPARSLRKLEVLLLAVLAGILLVCGWLSLEQAGLAGRMVRLHVVANSDTEEDQTLKLQVRDAVLALASDCTAGAADADAAAALLSQHLEELAQAGSEAVAAAGYDYPVTVSLGTASFPTKDYEAGFALPAGAYRALRVVIGAGEGHNWWCVVFPSLCVSAASEWEETAVSGGMTEEDVGLMSESSDGYVLKFKCLEWLGALRNFFTK